MKQWKIEITMKVADSWIADGFDLVQRIENGELEDHMKSMLPHAYGHEIVIGTKVLSAPDKKVIEGLQNGTVAIKD